MNSSNKRTAPGAAPRPPARPAGPAAQTRPSAVQPKAAAPPVYRPQPAPKVLQPKAAGPPQLKNRPAAPAAYQPQPAPKVLQTKQPPGQQAAQRQQGQRPPATGAGRRAGSAVQAKGASNCCHSRATQGAALVSSLPRPAPSAAAAGGGVIQRIEADVYRSGKRVGSSGKQGKGGVGGVSHSEQKAWANSGKGVSAGDTIKFMVDGPICAGCTDWFEKTLYPVVNGAGATLIVSVEYAVKGSSYFGSVQVTGPGMNWGKVSEAGYFAQ